MIGHNHMRAQFHERKMLGNGAPAFVRDFAEIIQDHIALVGGDSIFDFPKQGIASIRDDGHEIRACLRAP